MADIIGFCPNNTVTVIRLVNYTTLAEGYGDNEIDLYNPMNETVASSDFGVIVASEFFDFYGYAKDAEGNIVVGANVSIDLTEFEDFETFYTKSDLSDGSGWFNISHVPVLYGPYGYRPSLVKLNGIDAELIGKPLPHFFYNEIANVSPITFFMVPGATINITAENSGGLPESG